MWIIAFSMQLALRAGNEKGEGYADTVGCCNLRVEHIRLHDSLMVDNEEKQHVVEFDFPGKDSVPYTRLVPVEQPVFENLKSFMRDKQPSDELFDRITVFSSLFWLLSCISRLLFKILIQMQQTSYSLRCI